jgi:glycosyltransferase involved in cell wall biosynthesis
MGIKDKNLKIAQIGPGLISIPPKDWGAIEIIIWNYKIFLEKLGHRVDIYNTKDLKYVAHSINESDYDFIHLHYDIYVEFFNRSLKRPYCCTTHYGYFLKPVKWAAHYKDVFVNILQAPGIIAISDGIGQKYIDSEYKGFLRVLRNGVDVSRFNFSHQGNGKAICLGRVEPQKRQAILAHLLKGRTHIDFVGPLIDSEFQQNETCRYLGVWDKTYLYEHLTDYSCLVLLSDGEAAPLVVLEALAAGLSIVVSECASANLEPKEFITILPDGLTDPDCLQKAINEQIARNAVFRKEIREYAYQRFDWQVIMNEYVNLIKEFNALPPTPTQ